MVYVSLSWAEWKISKYLVSDPRGIFPNDFKASWTTKVLYIQLVPFCSLLRAFNTANLDEGSC